VRLLAVVGLLQRVLLRESSVSNFYDGGACVELWSPQKSNTKVKASAGRLARPPAPPNALVWQPESPPALPRTTLRQNWRLQPLRCIMAIQLRGCICYLPSARLPVLTVDSKLTTVKRSTAARISHLSKEQAQEALRRIRERGPSMEQEAIRELTGGYNSQSLNEWVIRKLAYKAGLIPKSAS
jgi:hypothetical protein